MKKHTFEFESDFLTGDVIAEPLGRLFVRDKDNQEHVVRLMFMPQGLKAVVCCDKAVISLSGKSCS